jgi:hypothetical protein
MDYKLGLGIPLSDIDLDSFGDSSDISEEVVTSTTVTENLQLRTNVGTDFVLPDSSASTVVSRLVMPTLYNSASSGMKINSTLTIQFGDEQPLSYVLDYPLLSTGTKLADGGYSLQIAPSSGSISNISFRTDNGTIALSYSDTDDSELGKNVSVTYSYAKSSNSIRYSCDGVVYCDKSPVNILEELLTSCAGRLTYTQGKYKLYTGRWEPPHPIPLTSEDIAGAMSVTVTKPKSERYSAIKGVFPNAEEKWESTNFPEQRNEAYRLADIGSDTHIGEFVPGDTVRQGYSYKEINLPYTTNSDTAARIGKLILDTSRQALMIDVVCKPTALRYAPGDNIFVYLPELMTGDNQNQDDTDNVIVGTVDITDVGGVNKVTAVTITNSLSDLLYLPDLEVDSSATKTTKATLTPILEGGKIKDVIISEGGDYTTTGAGITLRARIAGKSDSDSEGKAAWLNKIFKVERWSINQQRLIEMTLREDAEAIYSDATEEFLTDPAPDINSVNSPQSRAPKNLRLFTDTEARNGTYHPIIRAEWDPPEETLYLSHYKVEIGTGTKWKKKILAMDMEAADLYNESSRVGGTQAVIDFSYIAPGTYVDPELPGTPQEQQVFTTPESVDITFTNAGLGYKPAEGYNYPVSNKFWFKITNNSEEAIVEFNIKPEDGSLEYNGVCWLTGDIGSGTGLNVTEVYSRGYQSKVNFTLEENILDYPTYRDRAELYGPFSIHTFDSKPVYAKGKLAEPFTLSAGNDANVTLVSTNGVNDFKNLNTSLQFSSGAKYALTYPKYMDFNTNSRSFTIEYVGKLTSGTSGVTTLYTCEDPANNNILNVSLTDDNTNLTTLTVNLGSNVTHVLDVSGYNITKSGQFHLTVTNRGSEALGGQFTYISLNGNTVLINYSETNITMPFPTVRALATIEVGDNTRNSVVSMVNVYDKYLEPTDIGYITRDLEATSFSGISSFNDIDTYTITGIDQPEFNGKKYGDIHFAKMTSDTVGEYYIKNSDRLSSWSKDPNTGLPTAHTATFGAYALDSNDNFYPILKIERQSVVNGANVLDNVLTFDTDAVNTGPADTVFNIGDIIRVYNVYDPNSEEPFSGAHVIEDRTTSAGTVQTVTWSCYSARVVKESLAVKEKDDAYLYLGFPDRYINRKLEPIGSDNTVEFNEKIIDGKTYTVKLTSVAPDGRESLPIYSTIVANGSVDLIPSPVYYTVEEKDRELVVELDFSKDLTGTPSNTIHTEVDLSHAVVVVTEGPNPRTGPTGEDPGRTLLPARTVETVALPTNVDAIPDSKIKVSVSHRGNERGYYVWARLYTLSNKASAWNPDNAGIQETGQGPYYGTAQNNTNLLGINNANNNSATIGAGDTGGNDGSVSNPTPTDPVSPPLDPFLPPRIVDEEF